MNFHPVLGANGTYALCPPKYGLILFFLRYDFNTSFFIPSNSFLTLRSQILF